MSRQCFFQRGKAYLSKALHFFLCSFLNESFKIEGISIVVQEDDTAKTMLFQGQGARVFIFQRKPYKVWLMRYS